MRACFNFFKKYFVCDDNTCRLLEVDISKQEIKFQLKSKFPILKCSLEEAINDLDLINQISPIEACYLGGFYGKLLSENKLNNRNISFLLRNSFGRYYVTYQDRFGNIGYCDRISRTTFSSKPVDIVENENIISCFNSSHACYIGILAGIDMKSKSQECGYREFPSRSVDTPYLRIVK